ncbi:MAG: hypothetical protein RIM99_19045 [Cyclobacteriaceae bacterium]
MRTSIHFFSALNFIIVILIVIMFISIQSVTAIGVSIATAHLLAGIGLLASQKFGWILNMTLSVNILFFITLSVISSFLVSEDGSSLVYSGKLLGIGLAFLMIICLFSIIRNGRTDILNHFKISNLLRTSTLAGGVVLAIVLFWVID